MNKLIYPLLFVLVLLFSPSFAMDNAFESQEAIAAPCTSLSKIIRRVAFDIGSGKVKMQVSDVDITAGKIVNVLLTDSARVALREDLVKSLDGRLSLEIQDKLIQTIRQLMKKAEPFHSQAYHAIATESFRLAKNGNILADRIQQETGLPVTIVSQEEEGILGFISAISESHLNPDQVVVWDFGGGSFQLTTKDDNHFSVYQGRLGNIPFRNALLQIQGKDVHQTLSPNPISSAQFNQAVQFVKNQLKDVPAKMIDKLYQSNTVVLAIGIYPLSGMGNDPIFDKNRLLQEIDQRLNLDDQAIGNKNAIDPNQKELIPYIVSKMILAYSIMNVLGIPKVKYVGTQGANAIGVLLSPKYWLEN